MKTIAYTALHYGSDYLGYAIRSVIDHVDEMWFLYTDVGSHGHQTELVNPDTEERLYEIARAASGDKFHWVKDRWPYEGAQRDSIHQYAPDADVIVVLDADEVWPTGLVSHIVTCYNGFTINTQRLRVSMIHMWRSFYRGILHDPAYPVRAIFPKADPGEDTFATHPIVHFGYAQRSEIVHYKQFTHGHKGEWRKDCDWFNDRFMANSQNDCHPVGSLYWMPETVNPWQYLPAFMKEHPFATLDVIP